MELDLCKSIGANTAYMTVQHNKLHNNVKASHRAIAQVHCLNGYKP